MLTTENRARYERRGLRYPSDLTDEEWALIPRDRALASAARAVLEAYRATDDAALSVAMEALATALARPSRASTAAPRAPRTDTKQAWVLALLRRESGTTVAEIMEATGWQQHTVRGFLAGLKKKGIAVTVLERIRQVGPNQQGAKGSYSVYRIAEAG